MEARDAAEQPIMHRTGPSTRKYPGQNVGNAKVGKTLGWVKGFLEGGAACLRFPGAVARLKAISMPRPRDCSQERLLELVRGPHSASASRPAPPIGWSPSEDGAKQCPRVTGMGKDQDMCMHSGLGTRSSLLQQKTKVFMKSLLGKG